MTDTIRSILSVTWRSNSCKLLVEEQTLVKRAWIKNRDQSHKRLEEIAKCTLRDALGLHRIMSPEAKMFFRSV